MTSTHADPPALPHLVGGVQFTDMSRDGSVLALGHLEPDVFLSARDALAAICGRTDAARLLSMAEHRWATRDPETGELTMWLGYGIGVTEDTPGAVPVTWATIDFSKVPGIEGPF
ncbi:hypothetical protein ACWEU6_21950 [Streptosporangium sandarakinum]